MGGLQEAQKHKKEEQQKEKQEAANATASSQKAAAGAGAKKEQDPDPDGKELASVPDPLAEAAKLVKVLRDNAGDRLETHKWAFEVSRSHEVLCCVGCMTGITAPNRCMCSSMCLQSILTLHR